MDRGIDEGRIAVSLHTSLSKRRIAALFASPGWNIRKCDWTDYEVAGPFADFVIEAESPILMHGSVADPAANVDGILAILMRAGIVYEGECYVAGGVLLREFRWGIARDEDGPRELAERVRVLVSEERGMRLDWVRMSSRLEEDLGMTGEDAAKFIDVFAEEFGVDLTDLDFHKHFGPEGCNPFWLFSPADFLANYGKFPVTVDHLVRVAEMGRWIAPPRIR